MPSWGLPHETRMRALCECLLSEAAAALERNACTTSEYNALVDRVTALLRYVEYLEEKKPCPIPE